MSNGETVLRVNERPLSVVEQALVQQIRADAAQLWDVFDALPSGREVSLAKTNLQQAVMWAIEGATK